MSTLRFLNFQPSSTSLSASHSSFPIFLGATLRLPTGFRPSFALTTAYTNKKIDSLKNPRFFRISCSAGGSDSQVVVKEKSVSVILLAGGKGKRMGASMPKQYLPLLGQPIALYSFYTFSKMPEVKEIIVVCDPSYRDIFEDSKDDIDVDLKFALPGKERQDSVYSGLEAVDINSELVCIHDSARPLVLTSDVTKVLKDGKRIGAAVLGVPAKATIKEANSESFVVKTLDRKTLWECKHRRLLSQSCLRKVFNLLIVFAGKDLKSLMMYQ